MRARSVTAGVLRGIAFGVPFEARVDDRRLLPAVRTRCPPGWAATRKPPAVILSLGHEVSDTSPGRGGSGAYYEVSDTSPGRGGSGAYYEVSDTSRGHGGSGGYYEVSDTSQGRETARRGRRSGGRTVHAHGLSVRVDGRRVAQALSHPRALDVFESELQLAIARLARPEVFVHAGVVAVAGRAIVVPGRSGTGKTTLVRALVDAGATYYSDEYAVLAPDGRVRPYARRPSVRVAAGHKERHPVPWLRGRGPIRLGLVVETRYRKGARWDPVALSAGECVLALLANTVPARDRPAEVLATLARASAGASGLRSERGPAGQTARALIALVRKGPSGAAHGGAYRQRAPRRGDEARQPVRRGRQSVAARTGTSRAGRSRRSEPGSRKHPSP